jgi:DeoR family transcriptional regulator, suf operon transcriptional repressor
MPKHDRTNRNPAAEHNLSGAANLLGSARGQILSELCGRRLTALELAERFSVSSNAIRTHLGALRHARLVRYATESRGVGKPTHVYELTDQGQHLISRAYAPALKHVLGAVRKQLGARVDDMLRDAGRALALESTHRQRGNPSLRSKTEGCAALLRALGGSAEVEEHAGEYHIRSECCPLASVVAEQPSTCKLMEGLAREITGSAVHERCERDDTPHCHFVVFRTPAR